ncbi:MAG: family 16 glycoside hydrolase [Pirellulaceae bacterium]
MLVLAVMCLSSSRPHLLADEPAGKSDAETAKPAKEVDGKWTVLQGEWEKCQFGGDGEIEIKDSLITMDYGDPITGVRWAGDVLRDNYEIEIEGRRVEGFDFFCALTFPVGAKGRASLVMGGWGGGTMGISSIDDRDASDNETTMFRDFKNNQWYKARVRVEESRISVWIDDTLQFETPRKDHKFDIRYEMDPCLPLGLANFQCKSELRNVRLRKLEKGELNEKLKSKKPAETKEEKAESASK